MEYLEKLYENDYACKFIHGSKLLGFVLNTSKYENLGFDCDGKNYLPVFIFDSEESIFREDHEIRTKRSKYVLFFKGCDDASYGLRFQSREDREQFLEDHQIFTEFIRTKSLSYN